MLLFRGSATRHEEASKIINRLIIVTNMDKTIVRFLGEGRQVRIKAKAGVVILVLGL